MFDENVKVVPAVNVSVNFAVPVDMFEEFMELVEELQAEAEEMMFHAVNFHTYETEDQDITVEESGDSKGSTLPPPAVPNFDVEEVKHNLSKLVFGDMKSNSSEGFSFDKVQDAVKLAQTASAVKDFFNKAKEVVREEFEQFEKPTEFKHSDDFYPPYTDADDPGSEIDEEIRRHGYR